MSKKSVDGILPGQGLNGVGAEIEEAPSSEKKPLEIPQELYAELETIKLVKANKTEYRKDKTDKLESAREMISSIINDHKNGLNFFDALNDNNGVDLSEINPEELERFRNKYVEYLQGHVEYIDRILEKRKEKVQTEVVGEENNGAQEGSVENDIVHPATGLNSSAFGSLAVLRDELPEQKKPSVVTSSDIKKPQPKHESQNPELLESLKQYITGLKKVIEEEIGDNEDLRALDNNNVLTQSLEQTGFKLKELSDKLKSLKIAIIEKKKLLDREKEIAKKNTELINEIMDIVKTDEELRKRFEVDIANLLNKKNSELKSEKWVNGILLKIKRKAFVEVIKNKKIKCQSLINDKEFPKSFQGSFSVELRAIGINDSLSFEEAKNILEKINILLEDIETCKTNPENVVIRRQEVLRLAQENNELDSPEVRYANDSLGLFLRAIEKEKAADKKQLSKPVKPAVGAPVAELVTEQEKKELVSILQNIDELILALPVENRQGFSARLEESKQEKITKDTLPVISEKAQKLFIEVLKAKEEKAEPKKVNENFSDDLKAAKMFTGEGRKIALENLLRRIDEFGVVEDNGVRENVLEEMENLAADAVASAKNQNINDEENKRIEKENLIKPDIEGAKSIDELCDVIKRHDFSVTGFMGNVYTADHLVESIKAVQAEQKGLDSVFIPDTAGLSNKVRELLSTRATKKKTKAPTTSGYDGSRGITVPTVSAPENTGNEITEEVARERLSAIENSGESLEEKINQLDSLSDEVSDVNYQDVYLAILNKINFFKKERLTELENEFKEIINSGDDLIIINEKLNNLRSKLNFSDHANLIKQVNFKIEECNNKIKSIPPVSGGVGSRGVTVPAGVDKNLDVENPEEIKEKLFQEILRFVKSNPEMPADDKLDEFIDENGGNYYRVCTAVGRVSVDKDLSGEQKLFARSLYEKIDKEFKAWEEREKRTEQEFESWIIRLEQKAQSKYSDYKGRLMIAAKGKDYYRFMYKGLSEVLVNIKDEVNNYENQNGKKWINELTDNAGHREKIKTLYESNLENAAKVDIYQGLNKEALEQIAKNATIISYNKTKK